MLVGCVMQWLGGGIFLWLYRVILAYCFFFNISSHFQHQAELSIVEEVKMKVVGQCSVSTSVLYVGVSFSRNSLIFSVFATFLDNFIM